MWFVRYIKHLFIPHEGNEQIPHMIRETGVATVLFLSVFLLGISFGSSLFLHRTVLGATISSGVLIDLTNESRLAYNQPLLVRNEKLDQAAYLKGEDMAAKQYFSHDSPEGVPPWYWIRKVGYNFIYAGENLAIDFTEALDVREAWLQSPAHRANIMNVDFQDIGLAVVEGVYHERPTMYIVQMFGTEARREFTKPKISLPLKKDTSKKQGLVVAETSSSSLATAATTTTTATGSVKGDVFKDSNLVLSISSSTTLLASSSPATSSIEKLLITQDTLIVKDTSKVAPKKNFAIFKQYSTWYHKLIFYWPTYVDFIYKALILLIAFTLVITIIIEIRKEHIQHIIFSLLILLLLVLFVYINQSFM